MSAVGLTVEGLGHRFDHRPILDSVGVAVAPGEIVCLLGPSGSGKSTLLRIVAGLEPIQTGRILIDGREVAGPRGSLPPERRGVGLMFQDFALFPHLTVARNVAFGLTRTAPSERQRRVGEMLSRVGMAAFADAYPHTLSGGEQQRVALARALAPQPRVMLLDEPFSGLDVETRERVRQEAARLLRAAGTPTLLVTHDPDEAMRTADRIVLMREGRVVQDGTPRELYYQPSSAFCAAFLSETNLFRTTVAAGTAETPLGPVSVEGFPDGTAVDVVARPESVSVAADAAGSAAGVPAIVTSVRELGHASLVDLSLLAFGGLAVARLAASEPPPVGATVRVALDRDRAFVFAAEKS